jgi:Arc/MetJ-type ribon-helix-helix transcriptional regulator
VNAKLRTGAFKTASDVVCEGLAHHAASERDQKQQRAEFQRAIREGLASAQRMASPAEPPSLTRFSEGCVETSGLRAGS